MAKTPLTEDELTARIGQLPGWSIQEESIHRDFEFADFAVAFGFMAALATVAGEMNHHPDWSNSYSSVSISLSTHVAGGVTDLDIEFAARASELAEVLGSE